MILLDFAHGHYMAAMAPSITALHNNIQRLKNLHFY